MFIYVVYKDAPELSTFRRQSMEEDLSQEKTLLVNPDCHVRVMLEYIRKECKLAATTQFDLSDENGFLKGLFSYPTFAYATQQFEHKHTYYLIVLRPVGEMEKHVVVLPQLNRANKLYLDLQSKVKRFIAGELDPVSTTTGKSTNTSKKKSPV